MFERPTGNRYQDKEPNLSGISVEEFPVSKKKSPTLRDILFSAIGLIVFGLGFHHIYSEGIETGILRFGGRSVKTIIKVNDPESFIFWSNVFFGASVFCWVAGFSVLLLALNNRKSRK